MITLLCRLFIHHLWYSARFLHRAEFSGLSSVIVTPFVRSFLIRVAEARSLRRHDFRDLDVRDQVEIRHDIVERGLNSVCVLGLVAAESSESRFGVLLLPQSPQAVDLRVMKEENRICKAVSTRFCNIITVKGGLLLTIRRRRGRHVPADRGVDRTMRRALQLIVIILIRLRRRDLLDNLLGISIGEHIARVRDAAVEVADQAMRAIPIHRVRNLKPLQRPVHEALLRAAALCQRVERRVAVAAETRRGVPDGGLGHVVRVEGPVPVARAFCYLRLAIFFFGNAASTSGSLRHGAGVVAVAERVFVDLHEESVPGEKHGYEVDCWGRSSQSMELENGAM